MLIQRQLELLNYLKCEDRWIKGSELSNIFNVSGRTIRGDIQSIKEIKGSDIILSQNSKGYCYNSSYNNKNKDLINFISREDRIILIMKELISNNKVVNIYDISSKIYISEETLNNDIRVLRKRFKTVKIHNIKGNLHIDADIEYIKFLLIDLIKESISNQDISSLSKYFNNDVYELEKFIKKIIQQYNFLFRYYSEIDLIIYSLILLECDINDCNEDNEAIEDNLLNILHLENTIGLNENNIKSLARYIMQIKELSKYEENIKNDNESIDKFVELIDQIFDEINEINNVKLDLSAKIKRNLAIHIIIAIERRKRNIFINNPIKSYIKSQLSFVFDIGMLLGERIYDYSGIKLNTDELCYITSYLSTALENLKTNMLKRDEVVVFLVVLEGKSISYILLEKIKEILGKDINITLINTMEGLKEIEKYSLKTSLIISTYKLDEDKFNNIYYITPNITMVDEIQIKSILHKEIERIKNKHFSNVFSYFFNKDIFVTDLGVNTSEQVIAALYSTLEEHEYVTFDFYKDVMDRESMLSTDIESGIAIPHATKFNSNKTGVCVGILNKPILWNKFYVKVVLLFSVSKEDTKKQRILYEYIMKSLGDKNIIEKLSLSRDIDGFKKILQEQI